MNDIPVIAYAPIALFITASIVGTLLVGLLILVAMGVLLHDFVVTVRNLIVNVRAR